MHDARIFLLAKAGNRKQGRDDRKQETGNEYVLLSSCLARKWRTMATVQFPTSPSILASSRTDHRMIATQVCRESVVTGFWLLDSSAIDWARRLDWLPSWLCRRLAEFRGGSFGKGSFGILEFGSLGVWELGIGNQKRSVKSFIRI